MRQVKVWLGVGEGFVYLPEHEGDYGDNDIVVSVESTSDGQGVKFTAARQDKEPIKVTIRGV